VTTLISYLVAAISIAAFLALWFLNAHKILTRKRDDLLHAEEQVRLHQEGCRQRRGSPDEQTAMRMLETSREIYLQIAKSYHDTLKSPLSFLPGLLMGFRKKEGISEINWENKMIYICQDCGFIFCRTGEIKDCPYCGKQRIRTATEEEDRQLRPFLEEQKTLPNTPSI
jgi:DNA-directed RNA polymerase subunit RPC12/RpoP